MVCAGPGLAAIAGCGSVNALLPTRCQQRGSDVELERLFFILNFNVEAQWVKLPALELEHTFHRAIDTSLPSGADFAEPGQET